MPASNNASNKMVAIRMISLLCLFGKGARSGGNHLDMLSSANCLGRLLYSRGKFKQAEKLAQRAFDGFKRMLGLNHSLTQNAAAGLKIVARKHEWCWWWELLNFIMII